MAISPVNNGDASSSVRSKINAAISKVNEYDAGKVDNSLAGGRVLGRSAPGTGAVTGLNVTGGLEVAGDNLKIADSGVENAKLANMASGTIKARISTGSGDPQDATASQVQNLLGIDRLANEVNEKAEASALTALSESVDASLREKPSIAGVLETARDRPGEYPLLWTADVSGAPEDCTPISARSVIDSDGNAIRIRGGGIVATREAIRLEPGRVYLLRWAFRRRANPTDPNGDAVRVRVQWLDYAKNSLGLTTVWTVTDCTVASGRREFSATIATASGDDVDHVSPIGTVYARPYVQTYGANCETDIEVIAWEDVTNASFVAPDLTALSGRVGAIESEVLPARVSTLEAVAGSPRTYTAAVRADAAAASIPASVVNLVVQRETTANAYAPQVYERYTGSSPTADMIHSADGAYWRKTRTVAGPASVSPRTGSNAAAGRIILAGIDSLTDGAGGSTWRTTFAASMRAARGYGGQGYVPFVFGGEYAGFYRTSGVKDVVIDDGIFGQYALGGKGQYVLAGGGGDSFNWTPAGKWDTCKLYYLRQPGGGSFTLPLAPNGPLVVSTDGSLGLRSVEINCTTGDVQVTSITGNVAIFGAFFTLGGATAPALTNLGTGGMTLKKWAEQDSTLIRAWFGALAPAAIILNAGMNDRVVRTAAQFAGDLDTVLGNIKAGAPNCKILLVQGLEPSDAASTYFLQYTQKMIDAARSEKCAFIDLRDEFGSYVDANASGQMYDAVHPASSANKIVGARLAQILGLHSDAGDPGIPAAQVVSAPLDGELTTKRLSLSAGVDKTIFTLGIDKNYSTVLFKLRLAAIRNGTSAHRLVETVFAVSSTGGVGQATGVSSVTTNVLHSVNAGDGQTITFGVSVSISSDRAVVKLTNPSYDGSVTVSGEWQMLTPGVAGRGVYEY